MKSSDRIEYHMTEYPAVAEPRTSVIAALDLMSSNGIRHLPIMERGKIVGIVSERDLKHAEQLTNAMHLVVSDFMVRYPYCVPLGTPLSTVASEMAKHKYGSVVVLNDRGGVAGIFTTTDAMRILSELLELPQGLEAGLLKIERLLDPSFLV